MDMKKGMKLQKGIVTGLMLGLLVSILLMLAICLIATGLVAGEKLGQQQMGYGACIALLISGFAGAWTSAQIINEKRILICIISGGVYFLFLLCVTAIFFGGNFQNIWTTGLMILGTNMAAAFVGLKRKPRSYKGHKRYLKNV